jgi:hypothetical protein
MSLNLVNPFMKFASGGGDPVFYRQLAKASGTGTTITTPSFDPSESLMILMSTHSGGSAATACYQFNTDTGSNYANRFSTNGSTDNTSQTNRDRILNGSGYANASGFAVGFVGNLETKEKLVISNSIENGGNGANAPNRRQVVGKWANTSSEITTASLFEQDGNGWGATSEIVVLGTASGGDTVWEQLSTTTVTSGSTIDSGAFSNKKYLWIELYTQGTGAEYYSSLQFNSDTGTNYSQRYDTNGAGESTNAGVDKILFYAPSANDNRFQQGIIVNDADYEKMVIGVDSVAQNGAGASNPPERRALYGKWQNTSSAITSIQVQASKGSYTNATLKVWGFTPS